MVEFEASYTAVCHQRIGECLQNWDFPPRHFLPHWNKRMAPDASKGERNFYDNGPTASEMAHGPNFFNIQTEEFAEELGGISARDHMNKIKREDFSILSPHYADQTSGNVGLQRFVGERKSMH